MNLFAVFKKGKTYQHECAGIFTTQENGERTANLCAFLDADSYHMWEFERDAASAVALRNVDRLG